MSQGCQERQIAPVVTTLLSLYWQPDESAETRQMIGAAWLSSLVQFDADVVVATCREWWENQTRRPVLADIVKLARENQDTADWKRQRALPKPEGDAPAWFTADMQRDWSWEEYEGDRRSPWQRRSDAIARQQAKRLSPDEMQRGGRALCDQWARQQGYPDFAAAERAGRTHSEVVTWVIANAQPKHMPLAPGDAPISAIERERIRRNSLLEAAA